MIYKIINEVTKDFYIGKTTLSLEARFKKHIYNSKNEETYLYRAIRKYGKDNFSIYLIEDTNEENINDREIFWISELKPTYNMTVGGDGGDTSKSPNYIEAIKIVHQNKKREEYATNGMKGKTHSREAKERQSLSRKKYWSNPENRLIASKKSIGNKYGYNNKKQSKPIRINGIEYKSIGQASVATGLSVYFVVKNGEFIL